MTTTIARSTGARLGQRLRTLARGTSRSTTRRTLQGLVAGLLIMTVIVFVTSLLTFTRVHDTADTVRTRTAPAILDIVVARTALVEADNAAVRSFKTDSRTAVLLAGPGDEFRSQIAIASQSLTRAAEHNIAGEAGSRALQLVDGLIVTYTGMIEQADTLDMLGQADFWHGSLLHIEILEQLDGLLDAQKRALDNQLATSSMTPGAALVVLGPLVVLLALLVVAQVVLRRRFRRRVNPWLVLATTLLVGLSAVTSVVFVSHHHLKNTRSTLYQLVIDEQHRSAASDDHGRFAEETRTVREQAAAASANTGLRPLIYFLSILIFAAAFLGFRTRLYEYRYRPR